MNRTYAILGAIAALGLGACADELVPEEAKPEIGIEQARIVGFGPRGVPSFVTGPIARAPVPGSWTRPELDLSPALREVTPVFRLSPDELVLRRSWTDELGFGHARFDRAVNGLPVVGSELLVHVDGEGVVYAANGEGFGTVEVSPVPAIAEADARATATAEPGERSALASRLVYVVPQLSGEPHLAWEVRVEGRDADGLLVAERVYVDAHDGSVVDRHALVYRSKYRKVYDARNNSLKRQEGGAASSDAVVNYAYDNTGTTYDCYWNLFHRDSIDGSGMQLISYVHDSQVYNNAAWYNGTMLFGDGDGTELADLARSLDVTAHELTHGVVEHTANLNYEYESGALNEAWADIFGATCEAYGDGAVSADTWKIGEDIYTPGTVGDALRYMNNPTRDGISYDYWPERYVTTAPPSENNDMGGVHTNSGIANLAYYLSVVGGRHPRNKTTINVSPVGLTQASNVFYRAVTTYMTPTSNFFAARIATVQAASDLYGTSVAQSIDDAWTAVGVPGLTWLQNGVAVSPLAGSSGTQLYYAIAIPAGTNSLSITTSGGSGDCDLYVKRGGIPSTQSYDYKSEGQTTAETITVPSPAEGTWLVLVNGYSTFSSVRLVATWDEHHLTPPEKPSLPPDAPTP